MIKAIKTLLDHNVINEDTHASIMEAWDSKLNEARENLRMELREEFATKFEHDKTVMVEALDKMVTEGLQSEIAEFAEEKNAMAEDRVKFQKNMVEHAARFNNFMTVKLAEEIKELRVDRRKQTDGLKMMESFVAKKLAAEIREFAIDKRDLVETKVKLVSEANNQLKILKTRFIKESAEKVRSHIKTKLGNEITNLQEDIKLSLENNFGRVIFEAYSSEFMATHLNENAEIRKLRKIISSKDAKLTESKIVAVKMKNIAESKHKQIRMIRENNNRTEVMNELLGPLNTAKRTVMKNLLENVQTSRLGNTFEKYLPAVLADKSATHKPRNRKVVTESRTAVTGDKPVNRQQVYSDSNIVDIVKLAGINKK